MKPVYTIQGDLLPFKKECGLYQIQLGRAEKYKASLIYVKDESEASSFIALLDRSIKDEQWSIYPNTVRLVWTATDNSNVIANLQAVYNMACKIANSINNNKKKKKRR